MLSKHQDGEGEDAVTQDYTIYADENIVYEGELPPGQTLKRVSREDGPVTATSFSLKIKSFYGNGGGLQYFWYY